MPRLSKTGAAALGAFGWTGGVPPLTVDYLLVAGGGGGGGETGGGGGGGGMLTGNTVISVKTTYAVTVGAGGAGFVTSGFSGGPGANGASTTFNSTSGYQSRVGCRISSGISRKKQVGFTTNLYVPNFDYDDKLFDDTTLSGKREGKLSQILYGIGEDINRYTIDRVLRKYKVWEPDYYTVEVCGGYYGQEIEGVFLSQNIASKIEEELNIAFSIDDLSGRVEYLLGLEYGSLLPDLEHCHYEIIEIDKTEINFGSISHHSKVKKKDLEFYSDKNYKGIRGLVKFVDGKYRLIDGYHRVHTTAGHKVKVLKAFK
jgi:hypothetical protein